MATPDLAYVLDACLKVTLLLGLAAVAARLLRRASAATRHLVWALGIAGSLALPPLGLLVPKWELAVLPAAWPEAATEAVRPSRDRAEPPRARRVPLPATTHAETLDSAPPAEMPGSAATTLSPAALLGLAWLTGVALVLLPLVVGSARMWWLGRRGGAFESSSWRALARDVSDALELAPGVRLLRGDSHTMPVAWGLLRPAVLLPETADLWPEERRRSVLTHELAHVKRRDCLTQTIAHVACALYWFHPLVWLAARRLRAEREHACDDLVLRAGARGSDYADHLLELARAFRGISSPALATVAMARPSQLEGRLLAILDPSVERGAPSRRAVLGLALLAAVLAVPLAGVQPARAKTQDVARTSAMPVPLEPRSPAAPAAIPLADGVAGGVPGGVAGSIAGGVAGGVAEAVAVAEDEAESEADDEADASPVAVEDRPDRERIVAALNGALADSDASVRRDALFALSRLRAPGTTPALVAALSDADAEMRTQAAFALGEVRDRAAVEALAKALAKDANSEVRTQAAFALGQIRDEAATSALVGALAADANDEVRTQSAFALGQIRSAAGVAGLAAAIGDKSPEVRQQAVFALGQIRSSQGIEGLRKALRDTDGDVREQAAFALGQIRDKQAVPALVEALGDKDPEVREQAAFALGQLRDVAAVNALMTALKDPQAGVRRQAAFALSQLAH